MSLQQLGGTPIPDRDPIAGKDGRLTPPWLTYLGRLPLTLDSAPVRVGFRALTDQAASIASTNIAPAGLPAGLYRIEFHMRVTVPATVSSTITFAAAWTDGGVAQSYAWAALVGNTTTSAQSAGTLIHIDAGTAVNYTVTYGSVGATAMQYRLDVLLTRVGAV